jgi:hypothetical protein
MRKIQMPVEKTAIQELTGDELETLSKFAKSKEYKLFMRLADREKYKRYQRDFMVAEDIDLKQAHFLRGVSIGIDFILDSVNRAKEELKNRGVSEDEIDNEDEIK